MSETCKHNNHSHILLWLFVWWCTFHMMDCSGAEASIKANAWGQQRQITELKQQVAALQHETSLCVHKPIP